MRFSEPSPLSHRLTQLFILPSVYRTPEFLCAIGLRSDPTCPRCGNSGSLIHLLWRCPKLRRYWAEVVGMLNGLLDVNILVAPPFVHAYLAKLTTLHLGHQFRSLLCVSCSWPVGKLPLSGILTAPDPFCLDIRT